CKIMAVRAGYKTSAGGGVLESDDAAQAIVYATENGAKIINLSWGGPQRSFLIEDAIAFATSNGAIVCAASGNENSSSLFYPAALDNETIVSIGATDSDDQKASYSNYGDWVDVSAPGSFIYSTCLDDEYCYMSGTSMATPYTAGLAALIFSRFPLFSPIDARSRIMDTSDYLESLEGKNVTAGRINLFKALTDGITGPVIFSISPDSLHEGESLTINGDDFGATQDTGYVLFFPDNTAEIIEWSNTSILCRVPDGAQTGELKVFTSEAGSNGKQVIILPTYYHETLIENDFQSAGEAQGWQADEQSWSYNLPFSFPFFGDFYESVYICSNGYIDFTSGSSSNQNSFESFKARAMIAPLWSNLTTNGSSQPDEDIYIYSPSPDSTCIRWKGESHTDGTVVNTEIILHRDGRIQFNYEAGNSNLSPTIGVSKGDMEGYHLASYDSMESLDRIQSVLFTPAGINMPPVKPIPLSPANGETEISKTPELQAAAFSDPDTDDTHEKTRWQLSETDDFSASILDETSNSQLTLFAVPEGILNIGTSYYWRIKFYDNHDNESSWSTIFSFTTLDISPARIWGIVTVDGTLLTQASDAGYSFAVKKPEGSSYVPAAVDSDGLSSTGWYLIDIPIYHAVEQPEGAEQGDTGVIHVYRYGSKLTILSPADGLFVIGGSGSATQIDIQAETPPIIYKNRPPIANAGPDQTVTEDSTVTLDGSGSSDPDTGDNIISYTWRQTEGEAVALSDYSVPRPVFSAPDIGADGGSLTFELTVTDSSNLTDTDTCIINITDIPAENLPPAANAGQDQTVTEGTTVELTGEASVDPDEGDEIASFLWVQTAGLPVVTLSDNTSSHPTFFTPSVDERGTSIIFQLTVKDLGGLKTTDEVAITINDNQISGFPPDTVTFEASNGKNIGITVDN
ncbi:MAG: S8 family serine peptidase, partial [Deltaproteobacteria bacterium]|nr:S8 family serine peptidase [Deltaproteobacteria bacterium]